MFTGGEPLLQLDDALIDAMHAAGFEIAIETNGTIEAPDGIDWICVSPKAGSELVQKRGNELKLVYPQDGCRAGAVSGARVRAFSAAADVGRANGREHARGRALLHGASALAAQRADT